MNEENFVDYYYFFGLSREMSEKEIRELLGQKQSGQLKRRQTETNSRTLTEINDYLDAIDQGIFYLTNKARRRKYDKMLEKLYDEGKISNPIENESRDAFERAQNFYEKGKYNEAIRYANEAVTKGTNNQAAYRLLARCYYETAKYREAIDIIDQKALRIYRDHPEFLWLSARIHINLEEYSEAQQKLDQLYKLNPDSPLTNSEQMFLYLNQAYDPGTFDNEKGENVFANIHSYIQHHPDDREFQSLTASNIIGMTADYYTQDANTGAMYINSAEDFRRIKMLTEKAYEICQDTYTSDAKDEVSALEKMKYNQDNTPALRTIGVIAVCGLIGGITMLFGAPLLSVIYFVIFVLPWIILLRVSYRPQWKIDKIRYTGRPDKGELIIVTLGNWLAETIRASWRIAWEIVKVIIRTCC